MEPAWRRIMENPHPMMRLRCALLAGFTTTEKEWKEIEYALNSLKNPSAPTQEEYISRLKDNQLAISMRLNILKNNIDFGAITESTETEHIRKELNRKEYEYLLDALPRPAVQVYQ